MYSPDLRIDVNSPPLSKRTGRRRESRNDSGLRHERRSANRGRSSSRRSSRSDTRDRRASTSGSRGRSGSRSTIRDRGTNKKRSVSKERSSSRRSSDNRNSDSRSKIERTRAVSSSRYDKRERSNSVRSNLSDDYRNARPSNRYLYSEREDYPENEDVIRNTSERSSRRSKSPFSSRSEGAYRRSKSPFSSRTDIDGYPERLQVSPLSTKSKKQGLWQRFSPRNERPAGQERYINRSQRVQGRERSPYRRSLSPFSIRSDGFRRSPFSPKGQKSQQLSPNTIWSEAYQGITTFSPARDDNTKIHIDENKNSERLGKFTCSPFYEDDGTINGYEVGTLSGYEITHASTEYSDESNETRSFRKFRFSLREKCRPILVVAAVASILAVAAVAFAVFWLNTNQLFGSPRNGFDASSVPSASPVPSLAPINVPTFEALEYTGQGADQDSISSPSFEQSSSPTARPTKSPTKFPTASPTNRPTRTPSSAPSQAPSFGADPSCDNGIRSSVFCCHPSCGECGGDECASRNGGESNCCTSNIVKSFRDCSLVGPPCVITNIFSR